MSILTFIQNICIMYSSEAFGRLFWVDDELEFKSCPQFIDGTGDFEQEDYVSDWSDLEGVNIGLLFDIYKVELLNKINHGGSLALNDKPYSWVIDKKLSYKPVVENGELRDIEYNNFAHEITKEQLNEIKSNLL